MVEAHLENAWLVGARTVTPDWDSRVCTRPGYLPARLNKVDRSESDLSVFTRVWAAAAEVRAARENRVKCIVMCASENEGVW